MERVEKRKDAQVAREIVLAGPAGRELSTDDRIELARSFAAARFVAKGLAVQSDVNALHKDRGEGVAPLPKAPGATMQTGTPIC